MFNQRSVSSKTLLTIFIFMCVIIIKQKSNTIPMGTLKTSARINPHGLGIVWLDTFQVEYHKSKAYKLLDTTRPFIAHFRYATVGAVNKDNTHPFRCGYNKDELLMMNGTIKKLGNSKECDTKVLARALGKIPRQTWKQELQKYDSRFVTINTRTRAFQIYNRNLYTYKDGVWYSKNNVLQDNVIAVYGTLRKGMGNYHRYLRNAKHLGSGTTQDKYPMIAKGIPYVYDEKGRGNQIVVDVFKVGDMDLKPIDQLEGHPDWYERKQIPVVMKSGKVITAWLYFQNGNAPMHSKLISDYVKLRQTPVHYYTQPVFSFADKDPVNVRETYECTEINDMDDTSDAPYCLGCYNDLMYDEVANAFECRVCHEWYTETEVMNAHY